MSNFPIRKATSADSDKKTAVGGFHKSLWNCLQKQGLEPSASGTVGWSLIRAARPQMSHHATCLAELGQIPRADLGTIRAAVRAALGSDTTKRSPARTELGNEIMRLLNDACAGRPSNREVGPAPREARVADAAYGKVGWEKAWGEGEVYVAESEWPSEAPSGEQPMTLSGVGPGAPPAGRVGALGPPSMPGPDVGALAGVAIARARSRDDGVSHFVRVYAPRSKRELVLTREWFETFGSMYVLLGPATEEEYEACRAEMKEKDEGDELDDG